MIVVDPERVASTLEKIEISGDVRLDFSAVECIDTQAAEAIADLAARAEAASVPVYFRGVKVSLHKVLKLMGMGRSFTFTS